MRRLPLTWTGGHVFADPFPGSGLRALIDTGAGHTASHRKGDGYLGKTLADIEQMAGGTRIDLLVGLDAFRSAPVLLTRDFIEFGATRPDGFTSLSGAPSQMGGPVTFNVDLIGEDGTARSVNAFFDSGAEKSYIHPQFAGRFLRQTADFFPPIGKYHAFQFTNLIKVADTSIPIEPIVPADARVGVTTPARPLLIGSELLLWGDLWIDLPGGGVAFKRRTACKAVKPESSGSSSLSSETQGQWEIMEQEDWERATRQADRLKPVPVHSWPSSRSGGTVTQGRNWSRSSTAHPEKSFPLVKPYGPE